MGDSEKRLSSDVDSEKSRPANVPEEDGITKKVSLGLPDLATIQKVGTAETSTPDQEYLSGFPLIILMVSMTLVAFLMLLDISIIATAIPRITSQFHSLDDVGWYGSAYLLANCSLQPLTGKIYTHCNSKYTFLSFMALFELGSLLCGVAVSSKMLIVGRAVAGMGASGIMNGALTIISASFPMDRRPLITGIVLSFSQIGTILGPLLGGVLTQYTTWRWCFYINLPPGGLVAVLLLVIRVPDLAVKSDEKSTFAIVLSKLDLIGFALFAPAIIQILLALEWGGITYPWSSATIIGLLCGGAATLCVFLFWEHREGDKAMIPLSMVRKPVVWASCLVMFFFFATLVITAYYLPIYFQSVRGATPTMSGVYLLPVVLSQVVFAPISGSLVGRLGYYLPWVIAAGVLTTLGTGLLSTLTPTSATGMWVGFQILAGAGRGCGFQMPLIAVQNRLPAAQISISMALIIFSQTFGGALFLALAQTDFTNSLAKVLPSLAPGVDVQAVVKAGASGIGNVVSGPELGGVILAYNKAVQHAFYLGTGTSGGMLIVCWGMGWGKVKAKSKKAKSEAKAVEKAEEKETA